MQIEDYEEAYRWLADGVIIEGRDGYVRRTILEGDVFTEAVYDAHAPWTMPELVKSGGGEMDKREAYDYLERNQDAIVEDVTSGHRWCWDGPARDFDGFALHSGGDLGPGRFRVVGTQGAPEPGRKDDAEKPRISIVPRDVLREMHAASVADYDLDDVFDCVFVQRLSDKRLSEAAAVIVDCLAQKLRVPWADAFGHVVRVFEYGAAKYSVDNWRFVNPAERYRDAVYRHVFMSSGYDPESGVDHLAHGAASLMILRARQLEDAS